MLNSILMLTEAMIAEELALQSQAQQARQPDPKACPYCGAPEEKQVDASTMGEKKIMCLACRKERPA